MFLSSLHLHFVSSHLRFFNPMFCYCVSTLSLPLAPASNSIFPLATPSNFIPLHDPQTNHHQIHGFTGSSRVYQKNIPGFARDHRVIVPDLRGHGESDKPKHGYHVSRLAMDLRELLVHLDPSIPTGTSAEWRAIGGSLGCSILWYFPLLPSSPSETLVLMKLGATPNSSPLPPSQA